MQEAKWETTLTPLTWDLEELLLLSLVEDGTIAPYSTIHLSNVGGLIVQGNWGLGLQTTVEMQEAKWVTTSHRLTLGPEEQLQPLRLEEPTVAPYSTTQRLSAGAKMMLDNWD
jgi:hypothetical protein